MNALFFKRDNPTFFKPEYPKLTFDWQILEKLEVFKRRLVTDCWASPVKTDPNYQEASAQSRPQQHRLPTATTLPWVPKASSRDNHRYTHTKAVLVKYL